MKINGMTLKIFFSCFFLIIISACGSDLTEGENYGNLLNSESGLVLVEEEHQYGWGKADCTACHNLYNIHKNELEGFDMAAVRTIVEDEGLSSCATCHGTNGR